MISGNSNPMFVEETFKVNFYCSETEVSEFNELLSNASSDCNKIKEFFERVLKY
ncbi:MAG TPA: hypothetical protein PKK26_03875 [Candidatus Wallbacteria bacterium]|nr:hypothetical protein [Candidatus Wallbacteria bacterium]